LSYKMGLGWASMDQFHNAVYATQLSTTEENAQTEECKDKH
jgi:hypothetical protein